MPRPHVADRLRRAVRTRAAGLCEYCKYPDTTCYATFQCDHCVPARVGGLTSLENLAWACPTCNGSKGVAVQGTDPVTRAVTPLFNPRQENWDQHFRWSDDCLVIEAVTATGRVTVRRLRLNRPRAKVVRSLLITLDRHPAIRSLS